MPEVLRGAVVDGATLVAPAPVWDPVTAAALAAERDEAERQGYARGVADGRAEAGAEISRLGQALDAAIADLHAEVSAQRAAAIATDLELVTAVVDAVLGTAPPTPAFELLARVREAATLLDDAALEVRVNPADHALLADAPLDPRLALVADPSVAAGEASVSGTWGQADLRRAALRDAALAQLAAGAGTPDEVTP